MHSSSYILVRGWSRHKFRKECIFISEALPSANPYSSSSTTLCLTSWDNICVPACACVCQACSMLGSVGILLCFIVSHRFMELWCRRFGVGVLFERILLTAWMPGIFMVLLLGKGICFKILLLLFCECKCIFVVVVVVGGGLWWYTPWSRVLMQRWKVRNYSSCNV